MEINTQQLEALLHLQEQQSQLPRRNVNRPDGFDNILNSQLAGVDRPTVSESDPALTGAALYSQILLNEAGDTPANPDAAVMQEAMDQAAATLDLWDNYARVLGQSNTDTALKDAFSLLEGIDSQIAQLRGSSAMGKSSVFDGMVNELEILAATEKFKFNRGDYL